MEDEACHFGGGKILERGNEIDDGGELVSIEMDGDE